MSWLLLLVDLVVQAHQPDEEQRRVLVHVVSKTLALPRMPRQGRNLLVNPLHRIAAVVERIDYLIELGLVNRVFNGHSIPHLVLFLLILSSIRCVQCYTYFI